MSRGGFTLNARGRLQQVAIYSDLSAAPGFGPLAGLRGCPDADRDRNDDPQRHGRLRHGWVVSWTAGLSAPVRFGVLDLLDGAHGKLVGYEQLGAWAIPSWVAVSSSCVYNYGPTFGGTTGVIAITAGGWVRKIRGRGQEAAATDHGASRVRGRQHGPRLHYVHGSAAGGDGAHDRRDRQLRRGPDQRRTRQHSPLHDGRPHPSCRVGPRGSEGSLHPLGAGVFRPGRNDSRVLEVGLRAEELRAARGRRGSGSVHRDERAAGDRLSHPTARSPGRDADRVSAEYSLDRFST